MFRSRNDPRVEKAADTLAKMFMEVSSWVMKETRQYVGMIVDDEREIICVFHPRKNLTCVERGSGYPTSETIVVYVVATGELKDMYYNLSDG